MNDREVLQRRYQNGAKEHAEKQKLVSWQKSFLMPLIEEERKAFIKAEYGRLQRIMGAAYTEGDKLCYFHPLPESQNREGENTVYGNPEELTLAELAMLPHLVHLVPRLGTVSNVPLMQYYPEDIARMQLLANLYDKLTLGVLCTEEEVDSLLGGHNEYLSLKEGSPVIVIK